MPLERPPGESDNTIRMDFKRDIGVFVGACGALATPLELLVSPHFGDWYLIQPAKPLGVLAVFVAGYMVPPGPFGERRYDPACSWAAAVFGVLYLLRAVGSFACAVPGRHSYEMGPSRAFAALVVGLTLAWLASHASPPLSTSLTIATIACVVHHRVVALRPALAGRLARDGALEAGQSLDHFRGYRGE